MSPGRERVFRRGSSVRRLAGERMFRTCGLGMGSSSRLPTELLHDTVSSLELALPASFLVGRSALDFTGDVVAA